MEFTKTEQKILELMFSNMDNILEFFDEILFDVIIAVLLLIYGIYILLKRIIN